MPGEKVRKELSRKADREPGRIVSSVPGKFCTSETAAAVRILNLLGSDSRRDGYIKYHGMISSKLAAAARGGGQRKAETRQKGVWTATESATLG